MAYMNQGTRDLIDARLQASQELGSDPEAMTSGDPAAYFDYQRELQGGGKIDDGILSRYIKASQTPELNIGGGASNAAIQKRADAKFYNPEEEKKKRELNFIQNTSNQLNRAKSLALGQYRLDNAASQAEAQRNAQENAQRGAIMGQVLGVAGMLGGAAIAGPAGAMVGGGLGNAAGMGAQQNQYGYGSQQSYLGANTQLKGGY